MEAACGYMHSGACDDGEAEGATRFWWQRNLVVALWIALADRCVRPGEAVRLPGRALSLEMRPGKHGTPCGGRVRFVRDVLLRVLVDKNFALPHALPWPLCTCFWSPAHDFGLYPHVFCEICTLVCVALCDSRVVRIALLLRCRLDVCAKSAGCHVCRTLVSGVVSSLKVIVGVLETL